jgi:hypothetical protein
MEFQTNLSHTEDIEMKDSTDTDEKKIEETIEERLKRYNPEEQERFVTLVLHSRNAEQIRETLRFVHLHVP